MVVPLIVFPLVAIVWVLMQRRRFHDNFVGAPLSKLQIGMRQAARMMRRLTVSFGLFGGQALIASAQMKKAFEEHAKAMNASSVLGVPIYSVEGLPKDEVYLVNLGMYERLLSGDNFSTHADLPYPEHDAPNVFRVEPT